MRDANDDELRERCREHIEYIDLLETRLRQVEEKAEYEIRRGNREEQRAVNAERDVKWCARKIVEMNVRETSVRAEAWETVNRWLLRTLDLENRLRRTKRFLAAGIQDGDRNIVRLSTALNGILEAIAGDELNQLNETVLMARADAFSTRFRKYLKEQEELKRRGTKVKKTVVSSTPKEEDNKTATEEAAKPDDAVSEITKSSKGSKAGKGTKGGGKGGKGSGDKKGGGEKKAAPAKKKK
jgi:hypothetical protein